MCGCPSPWSLAQWLCENFAHAIQKNSLIVRMTGQRFQGPLCLWSYAFYARPSGPRELVAQHESDADAEVSKYYEQLDTVIVLLRGSRTFWNSTSGALFWTGCKVSRLDAVHCMMSLHETIFVLSSLDCPYGLHLWRVRQLWTCVCVNHLKRCKLLTCDFLASRF